MNHNDIKEALEILELFRLLIGWKLNGLRAKILFSYGWNTEYIWLGRGLSYWLLSIVLAKLYSSFE